MVQQITQSIQGIVFRIEIYYLKSYILKIFCSDTSFTKFYLISIGINILNIKQNDYSTKNYKSSLKKTYDDFCSVTSSKYYQILQESTYKIEFNRMILKCVN